MGVFPDVFTEMAVLLLLAAGVGALGVRLRQPLIVAFIAVGILVGPSLLGWVSANDRVDLLAKLAITLLLFGIAWAVTLGAMLGFSKEVGAFVAGVSLASTPYRDALGARLVSLRAFLLLFFFIDLGARLNLGLLGAQLVESLVPSLFVLIGNPLIVMVIGGIGVLQTYRVFGGAHGGANQRVFPDPGCAGAESRSHSFWSRALRVRHRSGTAGARLSSAEC